MATFFYLLAILASLVTLVCFGLFLHSRRAILEKRQTYHKTMTLQQIKRSRRFIRRSEFVKQSRLRRLRRIQLAVVLITFVANSVGVWLIQNPLKVTVAAKIISGGTVLAGGIVIAVITWTLNRAWLATQTQLFQQEPSALMASSPQSVKAEWRYLRAVIVGITFVLGFNGLMFMTLSQPVAVEPNDSASNGYVQQVQRVKPVTTKTSARERVALFTMYHKMITRYDLSVDHDKYIYHVIPDGKTTWYVLTGESDNAGLRYYYLAKVDAHQNVQLYDFDDQQGKRTALHGLVPAYHPLKQTRIKLGRLVAAYSHLTEYPGTVRSMTPGTAWSLSE